MTGGTRDQAVCCTDSAFVMKAIAMMRITTIHIAISEIENLDSFFCIFFPLKKLMKKVYFSIVIQCRITVK